MPVFPTRWMIRRDMPQILEIENESFPEPWPENEFFDLLKNKNCIGHVVEVDDKILGYMIYGIADSTYNLLNLAVIKNMRNQGVGRSLLNHLIQKMEKFNKKEIAAAVSERNLDAHLFLNKMKFKATVTRNYYGRNHDAYEFSFRRTQLESAKKKDEMCQGI